MEPRRKIKKRSTKLKAFMISVEEGTPHPPNPQNRSRAFLIGFRFMEDLMRDGIKWAF